MCPNILHINIQIDSAYLNQNFIVLSLLKEYIVVQSIVYSTWLVIQGDSIKASLGFGRETVNNISLAVLDVALLVNRFC